MQHLLFIALAAGVAPMRGPAQPSGILTRRKTRRKHGVRPGNFALGCATAGAISTCIDVLGSMALLTKDHTRAGVSVDMNMTFCSAARVGETLSLTGSVLRYGKSMGFTNIVIARQRDGAVIATGRHTKAFPAYSNLQK